MKQLMTVLALSLACLSPAAFATTHKEAPAMKSGAAGCEMQATEKKLAGAAKGSFMKKCESDAKSMSADAGCSTQAADKKLAGAAKASFVKKCEADAKKV